MKLKISIACSLLFYTGIAKCLEFKQKNGSRSIIIIDADRIECDGDADIKDLLSYDLNHCFNCKTLVLTNISKEISEKILNLRALEKIEYTNSRDEQACHKFIDTIKGFENLNTLDISNNGLKTFPEGIKMLVNLKRLKISSNQLKKIPAEIQNLRKFMKMACE